MSNLTNRELIELAAKAIGKHDYTWSEKYRCLYKAIGPHDDGNSHARVYAWNPLDDDGDAFQLAVTLGLYIRHIGKDYVFVDLKENAEHPYFPTAKWKGSGARYNGNPYEATRRAIVFAAAEIGRRIQFKEQLKETKGAI